MFQIPEFTLPDLTIPDLSIPGFPVGWSHFSTLQDGIFSAIVLLLISLLIIWWRQQSRHWFRIVVFILLVALVLCISTFYIFVVQPYEVGCYDTCTGWRGFPRPIALITADGQSWVGPIDFGANAALLWLILLTTAMLWRILTIGIGWDGRAVRTKFLLILFFWVLPWALLPRFLSPPQPTVVGEDLRLANNALRAAEFTYNITGLWVQRLALEDIRESRGLTPLLENRSEAPPTRTDDLFSREDNINAESGVSINDSINDTTGISSLSSKQVCLRGYTFFYLPWRRYRLVLEASGVSSVQMVQMPLDGPCWP